MRSKYSIYTLIEDKELKTETDFKKKAVMAYILTAPPLITKEMIENLLGHKIVSTDTKGG